MLGLKIILRQDVPFLWLVLVFSFSAVLRWLEYQVDSSPGNLNSPFTFLSLYFDISRDNSTYKAYTCSYEITVNKVIKRDKYNVANRYSSIFIRCYILQNIVLCIRKLFWNLDIIIQVYYKGNLRLNYRNTVFKTIQYWNDLKNPSFQSWSERHHYQNTLRTPIKYNNAIVLQQKIQPNIMGKT